MILGRNIFRVLRSSKFPKLILLHFFGKIFWQRVYTLIPQAMFSTLSDILSPLIWCGLDLLWVLVGILLLIKVKGKSSLIFFCAASLSILLSIVNMIDTYAYSWSDHIIISYEQEWHYLIFDFLWALLYLIMILCITLIAFRAGALAKRNRELESILTTHQATPPCLLYTSPSPRDRG